MSVTERMGLERPRASEHGAHLDDFMQQTMGPNEVYGLEVKKRYRNRMIKQMLKDAGYDELASMIKVTSERI